MRCIKTLINGSCWHANAYSSAIRPSSRICTEKWIQIWCDSIAYRIPLLSVIITGSSPVFCREANLGTNASSVDWTRGNLTQDPTFSAVRNGCSLMRGQNPCQLRKEKLRLRTEIRVLRRNKENVESKASPTVFREQNHEPQS